VISTERYRDLFAVPQVRGTLLASVLGRLPIGIAGLAILLFVQRRAGSFSAAGTASALYVLGLAIVSPFLGRLVDRLGPRPVLAACAVCYPLALIGLAALVMSGAHMAIVSVTALVAGATLPPVTACTRALYPRLMNDPALLQTTYSVDSALVEVIFVVGPAIVAGCVAFGRPEAAVLLAAISGAAGSAVFMAAPAVKAWAPTRHQTRPDWLGVLRYRKLLIVFAATLCYSLAFGLFEVAVTAQAARKGYPAVAGIALALASVGSGAGALVYGARHWRPPITTQFIIAVVAMAAGMLLLVPIDDLMLYSIASVIAGVPMATVIATQSLLVARYAPRERLAEGFTWGATCLLTGVSAGIAIGGMLAERLPPYVLLITATVTTGTAAVIARAGLRER
jgi:MFS family permease